MACCSRVRASSVGTDEGWEHWLFKDLASNIHLTNITFRRANLIFEEFNTYLLDANKANKLEEVILKQSRKDVEEKLMKARLPSCPPPRLPTRGSSSSTAFASVTPSTAPYFGHRGPDHPDQALPPPVLDPDPKPPKP